MTIKFQAIDWRSNHISFDLENENAKEFVIQIFGKTEDNKNIFVLVKNFKPGFYILYTDYLLNKKTFGNKLKYFNSLIFSKPFYAKEFYGFHGDQRVPFIKIQCDKYFLLKKFAADCQALNIKTYESNKDPIIQFLHQNNLKTCGWIEIEDYFDNSNELLNDIAELTNADINIICDFHSVKPIEDERIQKFIIGAMDIECISEDNGFPQFKRPSDKIVSIATTFSRVGESECYRKVCLVLGNCLPIEGIEVINCATEEEIIIKWCQLIQYEDPDIMTNWNGFGFDDNYIMNRAKLLHIENKIKLSRLLDELTPFTEKKISSAQMGNNIMHYYDMRGRVNFDLMKFIRREHNLPTYKLDYAAQYFFRDQLTEIKNNDNNTALLTVLTKEFFKDQYIIIVNNDGVTDYDIDDGKKFRIIEIIDGNHMIINSNIDPEILNKKGKIYCCNVKDDVPPKEIFNKYKSGNPKDLQELTRYNVQDCNLLNKIINKLNIMINQIGLANVCYIPINWIINRGQSARIYSVVSKKCKEEGYKIETYKKTKTKKEIEEESKVTYEGAIVFPPKPGMYDCVFTLDYASLYPTSIICRNISHETYVMCDTNEDAQKIMAKYSDKYTFFPITYQQLEKEDVDKKKKKCEKVGNESLKQYFGGKEKKDKNKICYFARAKDGKLGIIPEVLQTLLQCRRNVRKLQAKEKNPFKANVYNGLQLAYKIVCNSVYGQLGCSREVGPIALMDLAACTTATGRYMVLRAKEFAENIYPDIIDKVFSSSDDEIAYQNMAEHIDKLLDFYDKENGINKNMQDRIKRKEFYDKIFKTIKENMTNINYHFNVVYGDTDSIMVSMNLCDKKTGQRIKGLDMRQKYINMGDLGSMIVKEFLPPPENLEYEKILTPFLILSKKRYVGNLYEFNPDKYFQKNMGIVLKRRDNAQIVKYVVGGIVDRLINTPDLEKGKRDALVFTKQCLKDIIDGKFNINSFVITKSLKPKDEYSNWKQIAHAVLAERIAKRDPGNAPAPNDRIPFVYIVCDENAVKLQGDRIETPQYIQEHKIPIDYKFYIEHQLEVPCLQFLDLFNKVKAHDIFKHAYEYFNRKQAGLSNGTQSLMSFMKIDKQQTKNNNSSSFSLKM